MGFWELKMRWRRGIKRWKRGEDKREEVWKERTREERYMVEGKEKERYMVEGKEKERYMVEGEERRGITKLH